MAGTCMQEGERRLECDRELQRSEGLAILHGTA